MARIRDVRGRKASSHVIAIFATHYTSRHCVFRNALCINLTAFGVAPQ